MNQMLRIGLLRLGRVGASRRIARIPLWALLVGTIAWNVSPTQAAGFTEASAELREAAAVLTGRIEGLPRQTQLEIGTEIRFLVGAIDRTVTGLDNLAAGPADPRLNQELLFVADLTRVIAAELDSGRGGPAGFRGETVHRLGVAATDRLDEMRAVHDRWSGLTEAAVVEVEPVEDGTIIRTVDRTLHDVVRFGAVGLFLVGLLALGLRLLALGEVELSMRELVRQSPLFALGGAAILTAFLAATAMAAFQPALVAGLAERSEFHPAAGPCDRLEIQRGQLIEARRLGHEGLRDAIKDRMRPVAQDCLELGSQVAAVEAIEWMAANLDPMEEPRESVGAAVDEDPMDREIERLLTAVQSLRSGDGELERGANAPTELGTGTGGPVEEIASGDDGEDTVAGDGDEPAAARARLVVTTTRVNFREAPSVDARRLGTLPSGTAATLLTREGEWSNIQLADGRSVFVASDYLEAAP